MHNRKSNNGHSLPTWLPPSAPVLLKKQNKISKYFPIVEEVKVLESKPDYSFVRLGDGRETTVSNRHIAPAGLESEEDGNHIKMAETDNDLSFVSIKSAPPDRQPIRQTTRNQRTPTFFMITIPLAKVYQNRGECFRKSLLKSRINQTNE